jgi:hypothetical protein
MCPISLQKVHRWLPNTGQNFLMCPFWWQYRQFSSSWYVSGQRVVVCPFWLHRLQTVFKRTGQTTGLVASKVSRKLCSTLMQYTQKGWTKVKVSVVLAVDISMVLGGSCCFWWRTFFWKKNFNFFRREGLFSRITYHMPCFISSHLLLLSASFVNVSFICK